jgi:hypothetical protein
MSMDKKEYARGPIVQVGNIERCLCNKEVAGQEHRDRDQGWITAASGGQAELKEMGV